MNFMRHGSLAGGLLVAVLLSMSAGCGVVQQINYIINGFKVDAKFAGLEDKKIAVVCVAGPGVPPNGEASMIANIVGTKIGAEVKGAQIISQAKIADWMDKNDWDQVDYADVGRGV